jgi:5-methylcytosine-specific restriction endonuclease McrA
MLHQFQALKAPAADTARDRSETGGGGGAGRTLAGNMVEVSGAAQAAPVTTTRSRGGEIAGLTAGMSGRVFVLGKNQQPLMPCHPARARALLHAGRAVIHRRFPLVIRLTDRATGAIQPVVIKFDPGARTTGIAVARADATNSKRQHVLFTAELEHRGTQIRDSITQRAAFRRARRGRKTRYRAPRFENRGGDRRGWLPPSLRHRVETSASWSVRLRRFAPVSGVAIELVRFDTQFMQNSEISGVQYQQGELAGYEVREYLLEKWSRHCVYCDAEDTPLQIEHIVSKARGGSNRVSNLTLACPACNQAKGSRTLEEFLSHDPDRARQILARAKAPLASAATINATRFAMLAALRASGLPVKTGSGGRTKWNRSRFGLPKTHALDAACVGDVDILTGTRTQSLAIKCTGRGSRQRTRLTAQGFPRGYLSPAKRHFGFRTGDIVVATVPAGRKTGTHQGRVAVRASGSFNIQTSLSTVQGISHRHCRILQSADGYAYLQSQPCAASSCPVNGTGIRGVTV